jgi:hypothetical protein
LATVDHIISTVASSFWTTAVGCVRLYFSDYVAAHGYDYFGANNNLKQSVTVSIAGGVTDASGPSLSNGSSDTSNSYVLAKGTDPVIDMTMNLPTSEAAKYPFDSYEGKLFGTVTTSTGRLVPSFVAGFMAADGWTLSHVPFPEAKSYGMALEIKRAADSQLYALFILVLMWALAIGGVVMALVLMRSGKHIGADHLVYLAALLFALPLMRTLLPGNPSLGVLADFAAYFWVEVVVGLTLLMLLIAWIRHNRPPRVHNPLDGKKQEASTDRDTATASRQT